MVITLDSVMNGLPIKEKRRKWDINFVEYKYMWISVLFLPNYQLVTEQILFKLVGVRSLLKSL